MSRMGDAQRVPTSLGGHSSQRADMLPDLTAVDWSSTPRCREEQDLLALIRQEPDNVDHRIIYSYFLDEQGTRSDDARAALIRYMCADERYREVFNPSLFTGMAEGAYIYRRIIGGEGDGQIFPQGRLMLQRGLISEAIISAARLADEPGTRLVARALSAHPVQRLVLHQTSEEVARILESGQVMDGVRSLVLNETVGGGRLGARALRLEEVTCSLSDAAEVCRAPNSAADIPSERIRRLSAVNILERENVSPSQGAWRLLGRDVLIRITAGEYDLQGIERFVEPGVTRSLQMQAILSPHTIREIANLAPHLERLSFVWSSVSDDSWRELLSYDFPKLREVQINGTDAPADTLTLLSRNAAAQSLVRIRLSEDAARLDAELGLLADRHLFPALQCVELGAEKRRPLLLAGVAVEAPTYFGWRS